MRNLLFLGLAILISGCAVLDVASLERAIPLQPGKVELSINQSAGLDLESVVLDPDDYGQEFPPPGYTPGTSTVTGVQAALGLQNQIELGSRAWVSANNFGVKLFLKKLMSQNRNNYLAIQPAFTYLDSVDDDTPDGDSRYQAVGSELQVLYTHKASPNFSFTLIGRGNFNRYEETHYDANSEEYIDGPYTIIHGGVRGNFELRIHPFFLIPEVGFEIVPVVNGRTSTVPVAGFALGVEL